MKHIVRNILLVITFLGLFFIANEVFAKAPVLNQKELASPPPRIIRTCCSFGADMGFVGIPFAKKTDITAPALLGRHLYLGGKDENNGNIYTKRGGFIDLGHLRDCADWTAYLYNLILAGELDPELTTIDLGNEGGSKILTINSAEISDSATKCELAGKIAYDLSVWHEISTWFGASYVPMLPERYSSFSPEDLYSNLLGVILAMQAINSPLDYNDAMTLLIAEMLDELETVATVEETYAAMLGVDRLWYTSSKKLPSKKVLLKRYLDSGAALVPWLVPEGKNLSGPFVLNKPDDCLTDYYELSIKLNFKFPVRSLLAEQEGRIATQNDFGVFIDFIQNDLERLHAKEEIRLGRHEKRKGKNRDQEKMSHPGKLI